MINARFVPQKEIAPQKFNDLSSAFAILNLQKKSGPITGRQMMNTIITSTHDRDNQAAGKEYVDLKGFVSQNAHRLTPDAQLKFNIYEKYVRKAQSQGSTGINIVDYKRMVIEMRNSRASDILPPVRSLPQPEQVSRQFSNLERGLPPAGPCLSAGLAALPTVFETASFPPQPISSSSQYGIAADETAKVWGDPHFVDPDGGKFDVQGEPGKTYNLLNDTGIALNARFDAYGKGGATVIGETGMTLTGLRGVSQIQYSKTGTAAINGHPMQPGSMETLADGGHAHLSSDGKTLTIMTGEGYTVTQRCQGTSHIDADVKSPREGVATDGRMPGGLLGQTFDADKAARNSNGSQGEGAIAGTVRDYEVGTLFGRIPFNIQQGASPSVFSNLTRIFDSAGLTPPLTLPNSNPITGAPVNWNQSITDQTTDFMIGQANRQTMFRQMNEDNQKADKLLQMLLTALQMGNIDLAMLLFASQESREATKLTQVLTQKLLQTQQRRRELTGQLAKQGQDQNGQNQTAQVQANVQEVNDTIQLLTSFIKDVNEQKNRTMEFANNFLASEHQTTMSIVRGMK